MMPHMLCIYDPASYLYKLSLSQGRTGLLSALFCLRGEVAVVVYSFDGMVVQSCHHS